MFVDLRSVMDEGSGVWPDLAYHAWRDTAATLQLWTQIVGKVRLSLTPWVNHGWQVPLYVTARGLGTGPTPFGSELVDIEFDFIDHCLRIRTSRGETREFPLQGQSVAAFYVQVLEQLKDIGVEVSISQRPSEWVDPLPFSEDEIHADYDPVAVHRFWRALIQVD